MKRSDFEWTPNERLGRIRFGEPVTPFVEAGILESRESLSDGNESICFVFGDDEEILVYADERGVIDIIATDGPLYFRGRNLIGLSLDVAVKIIGQEPVNSDDPFVLADDDVEFVAEFDGLGLALWIRDDIVVSASLLNDNDDGAL